MEDVSLSQPPKYEDRARTTKTTHVRALVILLTAVVIVTGLVGAVWIVSRGLNERCPISDKDETRAMPKLLDGDKEENIVVNVENEMYTMPMSFNYDSNTLLEESANISGNAEATLAFDFDRRVVFAKLHVENKCVAFVLPESVMESVGELMKHSEEEIAEAALARLIYFDLDIGDEIPSAYVQNTNGPIIRGMCAGMHSYWSEVVLSTNNRQKRGFWDELTKASKAVESVAIAASAAAVAYGAWLVVG